jgi:acetyl esterase
MINAEINPFLEEWAKQWASVPSNATPAQRRAHFEIVAKAMRLPLPKGVKTRVHDFNGVYVLETYSSDKPTPALIYMHGGAYMQGSPDTHLDITARLTAWSGFRVFSVDYALAPERPFPQGLNDVLCVADMLYAQPAKYHITPNKIAIGGDSAGASLAAVACLIYRDAGKSFLGQLLIYPATDKTRNDRASHIENANGPIINTAAMPHVNKQYCPDESLHSSFKVSPLLAASHKGLPPAFVAVAEHDPLRDDGIAYAHRLLDEGVNVTLEKGEGLIHGYLRAMNYCSQSMANLKTCALWLKNLEHFLFT